MSDSVKLTIMDVTKQILSNYPYMDEFLMDGCANYSAVAEKIMPKIKEQLGRKNIQKEAIIMSVIRYTKSLEARKISSDILTTVANSNITLKTDIMYLNIPKSIENLRIVEKFYQKIHWEEGELLFVVQGLSEISVVIDKTNYAQLKKMLGEQPVVLSFPLSSIIIMHSLSEITCPGFIHYVMKPVALAGISIELLTLMRDTIFVVDQKNSSRAFELLKTVIDESRNLITHNVS